MYSLILQSAACTKTISAQKSFAPMKILTSLLYGELLPRSPKMAVAKARKKGIIDFFYFSQPEDETVLWDRQILKLIIHIDRQKRAEEIRKEDLFWAELFLGPWCTRSRVSRAASLTRRSSPQSWRSGSRHRCRPLEPNDASFQLHGHAGAPYYDGRSNARTLAWCSR